jgi:hypothetical protein
MQRVAELRRAVTAAQASIDLGFERIERLATALRRSQIEPGGLDSELEALEQRLHKIDEALSGNRSLREAGEVRAPTISGRLRNAAMTDGMSDYGPTATHRRSFEIAVAEFRDLEPRIRRLLEVELPALEAKLEAAAVPWTPGRPLPDLD